MSSPSHLPARASSAATDALDRASHRASGAREPSLVALDDRVASGAPGVVLVRTSSPAEARAVREHVARRVGDPATPAIAARSRAGAPLWHDVLLQLQPLHAASRGHELRPSVERLVAATHGRPVVIVAPPPAAGSWDRSVALDLAARPGPFLIVFVAESPGDGDDLEVEQLDVPSKLGQGDRDRWWTVLADSATRDGGDVTLADLESWWARARRAGPVPGASDDRPRPPTACEAELLTALLVVGRPWPEADLAALGVDGSAVDGLLQDGLLQRRAGWLTVEARVESSLSGASAAASPARLAGLATALAAHAPTDPWASARAAEIALLAGEFASADAAMDRALSQAEEAVARSEIARRWASAVAACSPAQRLPLQCRAAERALALGEAEEAHGWARAAAATTSDDASVTLILGRTLVALGDLVAAEVTLRRGQESPGVERDARVAALLAVELAEVAYLKGDMAGASRGATLAIAIAGSAPDAREAAAKARNTLGKILLAEAKWSEADRHFAEDALTAAAHGDATSELRARLNRGIAFLSAGAIDEAHAAFEQVRLEGERLGDFRAAAFALDNLAVVATWRHDYAQALTLSERTLVLRRRLGDRLTTARIVGNLAELRRKLGLLDHAEHALAFGRRALGPGMPAERSAHFSFVAARIALDRGQTEGAQREISRAIRDAELAGHRSILAEAHRVSTRIALEDGDLGRARASLGVSRDLIATDEGRAEVALLDALLARAAGEDAEPLARQALSLARAVGEEEGLLEAHLLLCDTYRARGDVDATLSHLAQAAALRDQVAAGLPPDVAAAFLARRDVARLACLERGLAAETHADRGAGATRGSPSGEPVAGAPSSSLLPDAAFELVGVHPLMRGLRATIKKVARSTSTVLIRGESGTGKELVAAALHRASDRAGGPMVTVNCAALVETLLLSELFGHEKGAFTGATARRRGRFELAEGGTLFLDEIGDISPRTQVALLRVLQERTFERVGGTAPIHADVHIICATHRDLRAMVERGEFREDLYYRLRGITLDVPALRARPSDLPLLATHLLGRIAAERGEPAKSLSSAALELLSLHAWPGNVRELENALRAATLFAETGEVGAADLTDNVDDLRTAAQRAQLAPRRSAAEPSGPRLSPAPPSAPPSGVLEAPAGADDTEGEAGDEATAEGDSPLPTGEATATAVAYAQVRQGALSLADLKRQIERDCIARALVETRGNITRAAALLGMKRPRLSQLVKQYGLAAATTETT